MQSKVGSVQEFQEIKSLAERIAKEHIAPHATERDVNGEFPRDCLRTLGEAGLMGVIISQVHGARELEGHGYCRDFVVERLLLVARGLTLHFKTSE